MRRLTDWHRAMIVGLIAYVVSRLCVLAGAGVRAAQMVVDSRQLARLAGVEPQEPGAAHTIAEVLTSWDGRWYLAIVRDGYPSSIPPNITFGQNKARRRSSRCIRGSPVPSMWCSPAATRSPRSC